MMKFENNNKKKQHTHKIDIIEHFFKVTLVLDNSFQFNNKNNNVKVNITLTLEIDVFKMSCNLQGQPEPNKTFMANLYR